MNIFRIIDMCVIRVVVDKQKDLHKPLLAGLFALVEDLSLSYPRGNEYIKFWYEPKSDICERLCVDLNTTHNLIHDTKLIEDLK